jgi:hypothetical protein
MTFSIDDIDDVRLPESIEARAQGMRSFKTKLFETENGFEPVRRIVWPDARRSWTIESIPVTHDDSTGVDWQDIETVVHMFECASGQAYGFKYKPFNDHVLGETVTISGKLYKVYRTYDSSGDPVRVAHRRIHFVDPDNTDHFLVPVRFDMDEFEDDLVGTSQTIMLPTIRLKEILFP